MGLHFNTRLLNMPLCVNRACETNSPNLLARCLITSLIPISWDSNSHIQKTAYIHRRGEEWRSRGAARFCAVAEAAKIKVHWSYYPHPSQPSRTLSSIHPLQTLELSRTDEPVAFPRLRGWAGDAVRSGVHIEKEGGHRSFEDGGTRRCIPMRRLGRATETPRLAHSLTEKLTWGRQRTLPVQRREQTILQKRRETASVKVPGGRELGSAELGAQNG